MYDFSCKCTTESTVANPKSTKTFHVWQFCCLYFLFWAARRALLINMKQEKITSPENGFLIKKFVAARRLADKFPRKFGMSYWCGVCFCQKTKHRQELVCCFLFFFKVIRQNPVSLLKIEATILVRVVVKSFLFHTKKTPSACS